MKNEGKQLKIGSLLALLLFGVFAVCILLVLLLGADGYQQMRQRDMATYESRTAVQYLTTRLHQADRRAGLEKREFAGLDALVLLEEVDGAAYETKLYCYEGWLMELYTASGSDLAPADGEKILELKEMRLSLEEGFLQAELTLPDGSTELVFLQQRSGREVLP